LLQRSFLGASLLDFEASWRVFLPTFAILPVLAAPMPCCQLAWRIAVTPMPSSEAAPTRWVVFFNAHMWIAVSDNLALTILTRSDHKLFTLSRCTPWAVTRQFSRIHSSTSSVSQTLGQASWSDCSAFWWPSKNPDSLLTCSVRLFHCTSNTS